MSKQNLLNWAFNRHGYGKVYGYNYDGYAGHWYLNYLRDVKNLPENLTYEWAD